MAFDFKKYREMFLASDEVINDAVDYGVSLVEADVNEGEWYWKIKGIHHLLPEENVGGHALYLEGVDENGQRPQPYLWAGWTWEGRRPDERADPVPLDKGPNEPAGNIAIFFNQTVSAWMLGQSNTAQDKSDTVTGVHTRHPDEGENKGNSVGHHSFYVLWQWQQKQDDGGGTEPPEPDPCPDPEEINKALAHIDQALAHNQTAIDEIMKSNTELEAAKETLKGQQKLRAVSRTNDSFFTVLRRYLTGNQ